MFLFLWIGSILANIWVLRSCLKLLRQEEVLIEKGFAIVFWIIVIISLIPFINMVLIFALIILNLILRWIISKESDNEVNFTSLIDDIFRIKPKREEE